MKNKKIILSIIGVTIFLIGFVTILYTQDNDKVIFKNDNSSNRVVSSNALTMMYETGYESGEYQVTSDTTWPQEGYTFNEQLSKCENGSILTWDDENKKAVMQANMSDKCYVYFDKIDNSFKKACQDSSSNTLACKIATSYTEDGVNGLYYHDGVGTYINVDQEAEDNSYRFSGPNPNNYVCFGTTSAVCPEDNLYRIIGVFNGYIKLIKVKAIDGIYNTGSYWFEASVNLTNLNDNFYNDLSIPLQNYILMASWSNGNLNKNKLIMSNSVKAAYDYEIENINESYWANLNSSKIGLLSVSDYYYAASPEYWTTPGNNYSVSSNSNWLYPGSYSTIAISDSYENYFIYSNGNVETVSESYSGDTATLHPTFYISSDIPYYSGDGTKDNPYIIGYNLGYNTFSKYGDEFSTVSNYGTLIEYRLVDSFTKYSPGIKQYENDEKYIEMQSLVDQYLNYYESSDSFAKFLEAYLPAVDADFAAILGYLPEDIDAVLLDYIFLAPCSNSDYNNNFTDFYNYIQPIIIDESDGHITVELNNKYNALDNLGDYDGFFGIHPNVDNGVFPFRFINNTLYTVYDDNVYSPIFIFGFNFPN